MPESISFFSAVSYPFIALYDDGSSILRAQENSRLPMLISVWANVLNLALNLVFCMGIPLGCGRLSLCYHACPYIQYGCSNL